MMDIHIDSLFEHVFSGGSIEEVALRPVSPEILQVLHDYFNTEKIDTQRSERSVQGTNIRIIRPSIIINRYINNTWHTLLGRSIPISDQLKEGDTFKMGGGYIRLSTKSRFSEIDTSLLKGLVRECAEEGFERRNSLVNRTVVPLGVVSAGPDGVLALYTAELKKPISARTDEPTFFFSDDYNRVLVKYFSLDEIVSSLSADVPIVKPETVECVARSYFWEPSVKLDLSGSRLKKVTGQGNLKIPKSVRQYVFRKTGLDNLSTLPEFNICRAYYSVPVHRNEVQSLRVVLDAGIFLYEHVFTGQELGLFVRQDLRTQVFHKSFNKSIKSFVSDFLDMNIEKIYVEDMVDQYLKTRF